MIDFNDLRTIKKIDPQNTLDSTEKLLEQLKFAWKEVQSINVPRYNDVRNIVFSGMGASIYGALVIKSLLGPKFPYPVEVISDYHLPDYVNNQTLVVLTSYSGTTEEVLSAAQEAKERNAKMLVLTMGGKLGDFAKENNIPSYIFDGKLNPAGVPRLGCGYTILGLIGLLAKAGIIQVKEEDISSAVDRTYPLLGEIKKNAMEISTKLADKIPVIICAEHLSGNAQIIRNQFNETSKTFSAYYLVPDLNHHLMEGLQFPKDSKLYFMLFQTKNFSPKIQKRMELTREVISENKHIVHWIPLEGQTIYDDFVIMLLLGSYITLYLGLYYNQNPATNPWVDYFKDKLSKP